MPAVMKPVAPQATHGLPTSSLPEPPHFSQGFSPVPGVPAGASSPGFIFRVATMTACWFFDLLGFICNSLRLSNYHSNRHRRPRGPENRGHISPDHLARLIMCPLCIADDDRHEATAVAIRARSGVESAGASAAGAQALSALWRAWRCFVADASLWQYGGRVGKAICWHRAGTFGVDFLHGVRLDRALLSTLLQPITRVAVGSRRGGCSNVWNGAGDGTSHSSPSAPSHGLAAAGGPCFRIAGTTTNTTK